MCSSVASRSRSGCEAKNFRRTLQKGVRLLPRKNIQRPPRTEAGVSQDGSGPPHLRLQGRNWVAVRNIVPVPLHLRPSASYFALKTLRAVR